MSAFKPFIGIFVKRENKRTMKTISAFAFTLISSIQIQATSYYLSANGNDNNSGTSSASAWLTITKLNTVMYAPGDTVFFHCGDTFRGEISVGQGGNQFQRVVFTSYGSGSKPIISGAELNSGWTLNGTNYQSSVSDSVVNFFVSDKEQTLARYPNDHQYLNLDSATTTHLKDQTITGLNSNLFNGNICIHTAQWCWEKSPVSSVSADRINFTDPVHMPAIANYGYFLYNSITHLDTIGEWFYDDAAQLLYYKPQNGVSPNSLNCESSVYRNGISLLQNVSNVSIQNLAFEKQYNAGIAYTNGSNRYVIVDDCDFARQYNHGVNDKGRYNEIKNSSFREIDGIAVFVDGNGFKSTIHHNTFRNNGQVRNGGIGGEINSSSIMVAFADSCYIHHNDIDSSGYCGISLDGAYGTVERNVVKHAMMLNNDGAPYKSFGGQSHHNIWRNNFASESEGNTEGCAQANFITPGIYFDFNVNNCIIENNTVYNHAKKGIFQNSGDNNNTIQGNVIYGCNYALDLNGNPLQTTEITGMKIKHNVFFARDDQAYLVRQVDFSGNYNTGEIDSNYYFQPYNANRYAVRDGFPPTTYTFSQWQGTGFDAHTQESFVSWTSPTDDSEIFTNPSDNTLNISLQGNIYLDLDSNQVCGSIDLEPWTSKVLINTHQACTTSVPDINPETENFALIYPNPTHELLTIRTETNTYDLQLLDLSGRIMVQENGISATNYQFSVSLPNGLYVLLITKGAVVYRYKVVKE